MRLIDADVLFSILDDRIKEAEEDARHAKRDIMAERADAVLSTLESLKADIEDNAPTIDAVPVVRCKDCIYWQDNNGGYPVEDCKWRKDETPDPDDYCPEGYRKQDKE